MYHVKHTEICKPSGQFNNSNDCNTKAGNKNQCKYLNGNQLFEKKKEHILCLEQSKSGRHDTQPLKSSLKICFINDKSYLHSCTTLNINI